MTKSDIIKVVAQAYPHITQAQSEAVVHELFQIITSALVRGEHVELRGFGSFTLKQRQPHTGRNPKTGALVQVQGKQVPFFKPGKAMRESVLTCD